MVLALKQQSGCLVDPLERHPCSQYRQQETAQPRSSKGNPHSQGLEAVPGDPHYSTVVCQSAHHSQFVTHTTPQPPLPRPSLCLGLSSTQQAKASTDPCCKSDKKVSVPCSTNVPHMPIQVNKLDPYNWVHKKKTYFKAGNAPCVCYSASCFPSLPSWVDSNCWRFLR